MDRRATSHAISRDHLEVFASQTNKRPGRRLAVRWKGGEKRARMLSYAMQRLVTRPASINLELKRVLPALKLDDWRFRW